MSLLVDIKKDLGGFALDMKFETGKGTLGFLGGSGCGKSMTLKCIAGIETPDEGRIILDGQTLFDREKHINLRPQERRVGYLFQNYALFPNMTAWQNIRCGLCRGKDRGKKDAIVRDMVDKMALSGLEKRRPNQLSGGQQQRVALARILVNQPKLLLLDEPFSALDSYLRVQMQAEMKRLLAEYGKDAIFVSHSRDEVYRVCDTAAIMEDGRILRQGPVKEVFAHPGCVAGAILTGCKNIIKARKTGEYEVEAIGWGMRFKTEEAVPEDIGAIAIRAHYFDPGCMENRGRIRFVEAVEEPFEWIFQFRYEGADEDAVPAWWRLPKEKKPSPMPEELGILPRDIMLLR